MQFDRLKRRGFIILIGGAAAWPLVAQAQQPAMPLIGFLSGQSSGAFADQLRGFRQGLREAGFVEGENVAIMYRFAENQNDRLPELASDLVRRQVAVLVATNQDAAFAAKAATTSIPIAFIAGDDPVRLGLVSSLAKPGGNATGINFFVIELTAKRLELLRELVPGAKRIVALVNPASPSVTDVILRNLDAAGRAMGVQIQTLNASTTSEIDAAFATFLRERPDAVFVASGPFFTDRRVQLVQLAARHMIPAIYGGRQFAEVGGLISYGASLTDAFRQVGVYAGRILRGTKPSDLPVMQSIKFELVINHQTARMLDLPVPDKLLATADEVIE
jgi:putative ABC transport system substrate-binding protein